MVRFPGSGRPCAVLAIVMIVAAGCGTAHAHAAPAGQRRSPRPSPAPSATRIVKRANFLTGVTCLPAGTCVAVGWYYSGATTSTQTLATRWDGRAWLAVPAPSHGHDSQFDDVSCATATSCLAVGTPAQTWTGTHWSIVPRPPAGPLTSVSCTSATACVTVGSNQTTTMAERWNGTTWTVQPTPNPA